MKHTLIIIGEEIMINNDYKDYICRKYREHFDELGDILYLFEDKDLPFTLESLSKKADFITIFAMPSSYATTAKILATLCEDNLILKDELLVPSMAKCAQNSFLVHLNNAQINLILAQIDEKLPKLLCKHPFTFIYFCLLGMDKDSVQILISSIANIHQISLVCTQLLDDLVLIKASASGFTQLEGFMEAAFKLFENRIFLGANPIEYIVNKLLELKLKISFAESCTGGLLASTLTSFDGVSQIYDGSMITYSNTLKHKWLGVGDDILENGGVYSERCVYFMLKGVFKTTSCEFALAISGVAGEEEDLGCKPGVVYIGCMFKDGSFIQERLVLRGDRNFIRQKARLACFALLIKLKPTLFLG